MKRTQHYGVGYDLESGYTVYSIGNGKVVYSDNSKAMCIAKAQELNGWFVNGNEQSYGRQQKGEKE